MPRADSTIRVNIIGDAKSLQTAAAKSEGAVGGLNKKLLGLGAGIGAAFVADAVIDFGNTAVKEADRVGDAAGRIESQLGELSPQLVNAAEGFAHLGASEGDMLELEAKIIDVGTALGITDQELANVADDAAVTASALALITDTDADTWMDQLGKAATGSDRAMRALGVSVTEAEVASRAMADTGKSNADALTESELAAARLKLILDELQPRIAGVTDGTADLEQRQAQLQARWETLTGNIGAGLEGPLNDLLGWIITGIDGWALLADRIGGFDKAIGDALTPVARMIDLQRALIGVLQEAINLLAQFASEASKFGGEFGGSQTLNRFSRTRTGTSGSTNVYVQGGSPEAIEQAVRTAIRHATGRGPLE